MLKNLYALLLFSLFLSLPSFLAAQNPGSNDPRQCQDDAEISQFSTLATEINTCTDDEVMDRIRFQVRPFRQAFAYIVVDQDDIILSIGFSNFINFDMLPTGTLRVYAFSTYGRITAGVGDNFTTTQLSRPCAGLTTNFVTVNNGSSGDITISSAQDTYEVCPGDGDADIVNVTSDADNAIFVITDEEGNVLDLNTSGQINFDGAPNGVCRVYALAGLSIEPGENVSILDGQGTCGSGLSQNFITVVRNGAVGGQITTADGAFEARVCPQDGNPDIINFTVSGASGETSRIIITDESNVIVGMPGGTSVDFDTAPVGICRAWNVAYNGEFSGGMGDALSTVMEQNACLSISSNFVLVVREVPEGGTVRTTDGATEVTTCPGDGNPDLIGVLTSGSGGGELAYVVTDTNNLILDFSTEPVLDLEGAGVGVCRIWGLTYQGELTIDLLSNAAESQLADNCFDLSDNFITVTRTIPSGGTVATEAGETEISLCPGDGAPDSIAFASVGAEGPNFSYVVTDENNIILNVPTGNVVNFENAGLGVCRLWGLTYEGILLAGAGDDATTFQLASGCFALSENFVTVRREEPAGGTVSLANGATQTSVCPNDGIEDVLEVVSMGATGDATAFVITDDAGIILSFPASGTINFEGIPSGVCRVYALTFRGEIIASVSDDINTTDLASACFALSENWVTVVREEATTGSISTEAGETEVLACPGDAIPDNIRFDSTGTTLENFNYLITDTNNVVIRVAFTDEINFETLPEGVCRVHGLGYDGIVTASIGQIAGQDPLATGCYALSENFVTIVKQLPDGGTITTTGGQDTVSVCSMDGIPDVVTVSSSSASGANFVYVATTLEGSILMVQESPTFDFELAAFGQCRIYGLSYNGSLLAAPGADINAGGLATGCADLSDNSVLISREAATGGTVSLLEGGTEIVTCPGDGVDDIVSFSIEGNVGANLLYLVTDTANVLLAIAEGDSFNFESAPPGTCRVWGLSFAGEITAMPGDTLTSVSITSGCFALSDNYLTVVREIPEGATVSLVGGQDTISFCSGDDMADVLRFTNTSPSTNYGYIIADEGFAFIGIMTDSFDFSNTLTGSYSVYGIAYTGQLTVIPGLDIFSTALSTGCHDLSDNAITLNVTKVDGGELRANGAEAVYLCPATDDDGFVCFTSNSTLQDTNYTYVITTATDVILSVMDSACFDFSVLPLMELRVYAISYTGDLLAGAGTSLEFSQLATGCATLSDNFVSVFNDIPEAGSISVDGLSSTGISCVVDGDVSLSVTTSSTSLAGYAVVVTDTFGIVQLVSTDITDVPFGELPEGDYRFYGVSYTGNLTVVAGDDIAVVALADNCYELTVDFVSVTRGGNITAGTIANVGSDADTVSFCLPAGDNPIAIVESSVSGINYRYVVTDTDNRVIAANLPSFIISFAAFSPGEYRIYGLNFTGAPTLAVNQILTTSFLSTECYAITSNFVTVFLSEPDGGMVSTTDGATEVTATLEPSDEGFTALVSFRTDADSLDSYIYVITDEDNNILGTSTSSTIDFGPAGAGVCRVWGLAYTGSLLAGAGDNAATALLTDGCYALSENFVTVTRLEADGLVDGPSEASLENGEFGAPDLQMSVYPNPSAGDVIFLSLESEEALPNGQLSVRDLNGRTYNVQPVSGGTNSATVRLDVSSLAPGIYFANFQTRTGIVSIRFMKN